MIYNKNNFIIEKIAYRDSFRPALSSVYLDEKRSVATDGFVLIEVEALKTEEQDKLSEDTKKKMLKKIPRHTWTKEKYVLTDRIFIQEVLRSLPESKRGNVLILLGKNTDNAVAELVIVKRTFGISRKEEVESRTVNQVGDRYPDFDSVSEHFQKNELSSKMYFSPTLMKRVFDVCERLSGKGSVEKIRIDIPKDPKHPISVHGQTPEGQKYRIFVMPMDVKDEDL